jgi:hypothetical protein
MPMPTPSTIQAMTRNALRRSEDQQPGGDDQV